MTTESRQRKTALFFNNYSKQGWENQCRHLMQARAFLNPSSNPASYAPGSVTGSYIVFLIQNPTAESFELQIELRSE
jgi:hypothetical protein